MSVRLRRMWDLYLVERTRCPDVGRISNGQMKAKKRLQEASICVCGC